LVVELSLLHHHHPHRPLPTSLRLSYLFHFLVVLSQSFLFFPGSFAGMIKTVVNFEDSVEVVEVVALAFAVELAVAFAVVVSVAKLKVAAAQVA
jgi:hypothetical protein